MKYWLIKSEPDCYSIDDFKKEKRASWSGVRNYQARNFIKEMRKGDLALFYHSSTEPKAVVGIAKVVKEAYPDTTAFDKKSEYYEPKATKENPIWYQVDFAFAEKFKTPVTLSQIKIHPKLGGIHLAQQGSRLSVQPVSPAHFETIQKLGK
ncbi:EVE domain-containing protein [Candidatus Parcubacteria bacterium]|nr:EVE domain-containing protein [Candidatus Parcubacteria bacterium]